MTIIRFYHLNAFNESKLGNLLNHLKQIDPNIIDLKTEKCYHIEVNSDCRNSIDDNKVNILKWIIKRPQESFEKLQTSSALQQNERNNIVIEIGPRFNFSTADSSNSVSICQNVNMKEITRLEVSVKYQLFYPSQNELPNEAKITEILESLGDRMTQCRYTALNIPKETFFESLPNVQDSWYIVPVLSHGKAALIEENRKHGLAFDEWDLEFYTDLFQNRLRRDPTSVELFDCAQSNSEHSRHWFFKGRMIVNGVPEDMSLIEMIGDTQNFTNPNNTIKFSDNSSAIRGFTHETIRSENNSGPGKMVRVNIESDLIFTAETHNMPTAVAPFSGATTGTGGRIRDVQGVGRGGLTIAGTAGYCVGNLNIPNYRKSYEKPNLPYQPSFATPRKIIIEASNGASDYGNKFGEPVLTGFAISYGVVNEMNERDEYVKPIMFSGGLGTMDARHRSKLQPKIGMLLAKIGGPVYRIGVGGGAASSVEVQGDNSSELDFNAVQRGDAEMENKLNRVVRSCVEMGEKNPILAIHDQGAGGNGNVLKELVEPGYAGALIFAKEFQLGDPTITALELWGAEYQENNAILCRQEDREILEKICQRERCPISFVGIVTGDGYVTLVESEANFEKYSNRSDRDNWGMVPFDMQLKDVLGDMPRKEFILDKIPKKLAPLRLPTSLKFDNLLEDVLSVMTVGSKRFLTNKVDRCVTGLVAQQQCVGPLHTPLSDYAITAISYFSYEGIATSIGTQPLKGLVSPKAGARMSVAEAISNLVFANITELSDVKCSGNWMWAAKLPGEGAKLVEACKEMCELMKELNIAVDGGKDSLSMATRIKNKTVKSPGTLVVSTYAPCPDVRVKITPDLKSPAIGNKGELIWVNIEGNFRLGGSILAQTLCQQGNDTPTLEKSDVLKNAFNVTQNLLRNGKLLAGHDISDGGLIVCLLEMAFGGMCGLNIDISDVINSIGEDNFPYNPSLSLLFSEECGWVLEVEEDNLMTVLLDFEEKNVPVYHIGESVGHGLNSIIEITNGDSVLIENTTLALMQQWERTNFELEKLQMNPELAVEEFTSLTYRRGPRYQCTFNPDQEIQFKKVSPPIRVAVIREEGTNGDREMIATLIKSNFEVYDVTMNDLLNGKTVLNDYRGVIFPGGFSYADTLGSAKGWAASIMYSEQLGKQFLNFKNRLDTFSLGVCNGCQLMSLIGWIGTDTSASHVVSVPTIALLENKSERYECRWVTLKINESKSIMLKGMVGSTLGCWVAHGEGRFSFQNDNVMKVLKNNNLIAVSYVDDHGSATEKYPMNPNGSPDGIAGICSADGRHLAVMPHPERCSIMWEWPYVPPNFNYVKSPWQRMFDEAFLWCTEN